MDLINTLGEGLEAGASGAERSPEELVEAYKERQRSAQGQAKKSKQEEDEATVFDSVLIALLRQMMQEKHKLLSSVLLIIGHSVPTSIVTASLAPLFPKATQHAVNQLDDLYESSYQFSSDMLPLKSYFSLIEFAAKKSPIRSFEAFINEKTWKTHQWLIQYFTEMSIAVLPTSRIQQREESVKSYFLWLSSHLEEVAAEDSTM